MGPCWRELQEIGMRMARAVAAQAEAEAQAGELDSEVAALALGRAGKMVAGASPWSGTCAGR
jgi:hypothetical protein